jgi:hypothetical protein
MDGRGAVIGAEPIDIPSNSYSELIQHHAHANNLVFEQQATLPIAGVQRPLASFHGEFQGTPILHVAVLLIGRGYRMAVMFQVPVRLENDKSLTRIGADLFNSVRVP